MFTHFTLFFKERFYFYFIFGRTGSSLLGLSSGSAGFFLQWLLLLWSTGSKCLGSSRCSPWAQQLWLTGSRASPTLAGGFLATGSPGKPPFTLLFSLARIFWSKRQRHIDIGNFVLSPDNSAWIRLVQSLFICPPTHPLPFTHPPRFIKHLLFSQHSDECQGYRDE